MPKQLYRPAVQSPDTKARLTGSTVAAVTEEPVRRLEDGSCEVWELKAGCSHSLVSV